MERLLELSKSEWLYKHERDYLSRQVNSRRVDKCQVIDYFQTLIKSRIDGLVSDLRSEQILEELSYQYPDFY